MLRRAFLIATGLGTLAASAWGQYAISARSGLIHHVEGEVTITGDQPNLTAGKFYNIGEGQTLRSKQGRAEILLNPGVYLRVGGNTVVQMMSSKLTDHEIDIARGLALLP